METLTETTAEISSNVGSCTVARRAGSSQSGVPLAADAAPLLDMVPKSILKHVPVGLRSAPARLAAPALTWLTKTQILNAVANFPDVASMFNDEQAVAGAAMVRVAPPGGTSDFYSWKIAARSYEICMRRAAVSAAPMLPIDIDNLRQALRVLVLAILSPSRAEIRCASTAVSFYMPH
jgi:hypothetical protein